jgi:hypothetical protein
MQPVSVTVKPIRAKREVVMWDTFEESILDFIKQF